MEILGKRGVQKADIIEAEEKPRLVFKKIKIIVQKYQGIGENNRQ